MKLVGRDIELAAIERLLARALVGGGGLLVFTGPAGVGKTALLDAAAAMAAEHGFEILRTSPPPGQPGRLIWAQLVRDTASEGGIAARLLRDPESLDLDAAARALVAIREMVEAMSRPGSAIRRRGPPGSGRGR